MQNPTLFHTAASIHTLLTKKVIITQLDDRTLIGTLDSIDQFGNLVLEGAVERKMIGDLYCDIPVGLFVTSDENLVLIQEMDSQTAKLPPQMIRVSPKEIQTARDRWWPALCVVHLCLCRQKRLYKRVYIHIKSSILDSD